MSQRDRDRLKVLHEVKHKHLTQVEAAKRLQVSDRQIRRLLIAVRERGDGGVVHRLRGRPSNRKLSLSMQQKVVARIRQRYADFGPTLVAEHLAEERSDVKHGAAFGVPKRSFTPLPQVLGIRLNRVKSAGSLEFSKSCDRPLPNNPYTLPVARRVHSLAIEFASRE